VLCLCYSQMSPMELAVRDSPAFAPDRSPACNLKSASRRTRLTTLMAGIDDFTAKEMGAEMIVHYGHSCLSTSCLKQSTNSCSPTVPVSQTTLKTLYVFVEIAIDTPHLALSVRRNFPSSREAFNRAVVGAEAGETGGRVQISLEPGSSDSAQNGDTADMLWPAEMPTRLALVSTIQFVAAIQALRTDLETVLPPADQVQVDETEEGMLAKMRKRDIGVWRGKYEITIPQSRPLSPGEVLGCTAPKLKDVDALMLVEELFERRFELTTDTLEMGDSTWSRS